MIKYAVLPNSIRLSLLSELEKIWILNDIFIGLEYRKRGVVQSLIEKVLAYSEEYDRGKVVLSTSYYNLQAQELYEKQGFTKTEFHTYVIYMFRLIIVPRFNN
jgi:Acetyltransferase (GNAT) family.